VVGGRRDQRGVVQSASYAARRFGIRAGMPIAEAVRLCPQATFFQGSFPHYREASQAVRAVLARFSPVVVMASLDEAYLDFAGTDRLYPVSLLPVAEAIRDAVRVETNLDVSIGIGSNRMIAKLASDSAKPKGLMEVRAGWEEGFLAGLPLRALPGIGRYTAGALLSFAYGRDAAILDTNVRRVLGRVFFGPRRLARLRGDRRLWELAEALVPRGRCYDFNQALMDFGAMVCVARNPKCLICPMKKGCRAYPFTPQA